MSVYNAGDWGLSPGSGRSPGGGNGNPLKFSYLENPVDRGTWRATCPWGHKESDITEVTWHTRIQSTVITVFEGHLNNCYRKVTEGLSWGSGG